MSEPVQAELARQRLQIRILGGAVLVLLLMGAGGAPDTLRARRLELVGEGGKVAGVLEAEPDGGSRIVLADAEGRPRLRLTVHDDQPQVHLLDRQGGVRLALATETRGGGVAVLDARGKVRGELRLSGDNAEFVLRDPEGRPRLGSGCGASGASTALFDEGGAPRAELGISNGQARLVLTDTSHRPRVVLQATGPESVAVGILDAEGRPMWGGPGPQRTR